MRACLVLLLLATACGERGSVSPEAQAEAEQIWTTRCANCHGPRGMGDGPGAAALPITPRVLADSTWQTQVTDEHISTVIIDGGKFVGLDANMAANPDLKAKPEVLRGLVLKVRSLAP